MGKSHLHAGNGALAFGTQYIPFSRGITGWSKYSFGEDIHKITQEKEGEEDERSYPIVNWQRSTRPGWIQCCCWVDDGVVFLPLERMTVLWLSSGELQSNAKHILPLATKVNQTNERTKQPSSSSNGYILYAVSTCLIPHPPPSIPSLAGRSSTGICCVPHNPQTERPG